MTGKAVSRPQGEAGSAYDCTQSLLDKDWVDRSLMEEKACSSVSIYPRIEALQGLEARPVGEFAVPDDREVLLAPAIASALGCPGYGALADFSKGLVGWRILIFNVKEARWKTQEPLTAGGHANGLS
ncbi:MAG: hypothetical protein DVS81_19370 [Candidatus Accumulibacter meliphilus]|uniref:Uncharacterized protein n=1 Tax=Candidatus Accumulibacter meliphilus TaxID=2211374 RepID=A0A369XHN1_9PROT|nr:MAG: hypothetical protein DVS81_19370 [Candidatus Accumulibacter meliphilus]